MTDFLIENHRIACFYRRMGYIEVEQGNLQAATACYQYSLKFEKHPSVAQELMYIHSRGGAITLATVNSEKVLENFKIPILAVSNI